MKEELEINPEFEKIIPDLSEDEFMQLEENILSEGMILSPLVVWKGVIIDGHNRFRIAKKHPEIQFTVHEKNFENEYEAIAWICSNQLGRRNLTEANRMYLIGKRYGAEKKLRGGDRKSDLAKSTGGNRPLISDHCTRDNIAKETNTTGSYVRYADLYARGVDAAEEAVPGIRNEILSGAIRPAKADIYAFSRLPENKRKSASENLRIPKEQRNPQSISKETIKVSESSTQSDMEKEEKQTGIEESILHSMSGAANMFIRTCDNYFVRFPKLIAEAIYRKQVKEIMDEVKEYINQIERV